MKYELSTIIPNNQTKDTTSFPFNELLLFYETARQWWLAPRYMAFLLPRGKLGKSMINLNNIYKCENNEILKAPADKKWADTPLPLSPVHSCNQQEEQRKRVTTELGSNGDPTTPLPANCCCDLENTFWWVYIYLKIALKLQELSNLCTCWHSTSLHVLILKMWISYSTISRKKMGA